MTYIINILLFLSISAYGEKRVIKAYNLVQEAETRQKIAVIDSGIRVNDETSPYLCKGHHYDLTETGIHDVQGHGTLIAGIIAKKINPKKSCLLIIKYFDRFKDTLDLEIKAFKLLLNVEGVRIINFSSGGSTKYYEEHEEIKKIIQKKIYFVTAAGNNGENLQNPCNYFPACYNFLSHYFRVVGNGISPTNKAKTSNYGGPVTDWRNGENIDGFGLTASGTSLSAAVISGEIASKLEEQ